SGGLLSAVAPDAVGSVLEVFHADGFANARVVGECVAGPPKVSVRWASTRVSIHDPGARSHERWNRYHGSSDSFQSPGALSHRARGDRGARGDAVRRGLRNPVDARCEPGEVAPGPHELVLRDLRARAEPAALRDS